MILRKKFYMLGRKFDKRPATTHLNIVVSA